MSLVNTFLSQSILIPTDLGILLIAAEKESFQYIYNPIYEKVIFVTTVIVIVPQLCICLQLHWEASLSPTWKRFQCETVREDGIS